MSTPPPQLPRQQQDTQRALVVAWGKHVQPQHPFFGAAHRGLEACRSMPQHAAASNFLSSCVCLPAPALFARETICLPHVSPVCFYLSCHESVICTNNIQSTVNTKHTTFPIRWENSAGEWERQPGTHARKAALQPPPICVEAPPQPNPTIIVNGQNQLNLSAAKEDDSPTLSSIAVFFVRRPRSACHVERTFSLMGHIQTKDRLHMGNNILRHLAMMYVNKPTTDNPDGESD